MVNQNLVQGFNMFDWKIEDMSKGIFMHISNWNIK